MNLRDTGEDKVMSEEQMNKHLSSCFSIDRQESEMTECQAQATSYVQV